MDQRDATHPRVLRLHAGTQAGLGANGTGPATRKRGYPQQHPAAGGGQRARSTHSTRTCACQRFIFNKDDAMAWLLSIQHTPKHIPVVSAAVRSSPSSVS